MIRVANQPENLQKHPSKTVYDIYAAILTKMINLDFKIQHCENILYLILKVWTIMWLPQIFFHLFHNYLSP